MSGLEKLYDHMPIFMQNIMCSVQGYLNDFSRYGKAYHAERDFLREFDTWSYERKLEYQRKALVDFLHYAVAHSRFYQKLYEGIDIDSISTIQDLKKLPIVDKEMLRSNIDEVVTIPRRGAVVGHTGGTTGKSLVVFSTKEDMMKRMAMLDHFKARVGFEHRVMKRATFNGKHIVPPAQTKKVFWRYNAACKQMIFSSFNLSQDNLKFYVDELNRFKPDALDGFFMAMCDIADYIERNNLKLEFSPIAIFPTSETLTPDGRELLERVFKCKVYDQYASSEGAPFITECINQVKHIELSSGFFEHLDDSDEVLVTSFTTHGTPLIRYRIGDRMHFDDRESFCSCHLHSPEVSSIEGRRLDFLYTATGAKITTANMANMIKNIPNAIIHVQFIQNEIGKVLMLLEVGNNFKDEYLDVLKSEFYHRFGEGTSLEIIIVDEIPRADSGKYRMIINNCVDNSSHWRPFGGQKQHDGNGCLNKDFEGQNPASPDR